MVVILVLLSVSYLTSICIASEKKAASIGDSDDVLTVIAPYLDWQSSCTMAQCSRKLRWAAHTAYYLALTQGKIKPEDRPEGWMRCGYFKIDSFARNAYFMEDRPQLVFSHKSLMRLESRKETGFTGRFRVSEINQSFLSNAITEECDFGYISSMNKQSNLFFLAQNRYGFVRSMSLKNLNNGHMSFIPDDEDHPVISFHWLTHELFLLIRQHGWYSIHSSRAPIEPVFIGSSTQCRSEEFSKGAIFDADSLSEIWKNGKDFGIMKQPFETNVGPFFGPKCTVVNGIIEWERTGNEFE